MLIGRYRKCARRRRLIADLLLHRVGAAAGARYGDRPLVGPVPALLDNVPALLDHFAARARATGATPLLERLGLLQPSPARRDPDGAGGRHSDAARALAACAADHPAAAELQLAHASMLALPLTADPAAAASATRALWESPGEARDVLAAAAALRADRTAVCCERHGRADPAPPSAVTQLPPAGAV